MTPTRKDLKNTDDLLAVTQQLREELPQLDLDVIDDAPHDACLARKQASDLCFDHMQGYYGMASLEALAQGLPTIAGLDDWNIAVIREFFQCDRLPWALARTPEELAAVLRRLVPDAAARREIGAASRTFMETVWSEARATAALDAFYADLR